jgi:hypothetical protein
MNTNNGPRRLQRKRTKGFKLPEGTVVCTRPGVLGNPFVGPDAVKAYRAMLDGTLWSETCDGICSGEMDDYPCGHDLYFVGTTRLKLYAIEAYDRDKILARIAEVRGMNLACYCGPNDPCHVDMILEFANGRKSYSVNELPDREWCLLNGATTGPHQAEWDLFENSRLIVNYRPCYVVLRVADQNIIVFKTPTCGDVLILINAARRGRHN